MALQRPNLYSKSITSSSLTFRQHLSQYLIEKPWLHFGIDLVLGMPVDKKTSAFDAAFLPLNLYQSNKTIFLHERRLVTSEKRLLSSDKQRLSGAVGPALFFWVLLILVGMLSFVNGAGTALDTILFTLVGLLGLLLVYLIFISEHTATKGNLNLIWANPLFLLYPILKDKKRFLLAVVLSIFLAVFLAGWSMFPQYIPPAVCPIVIILFLRLLMPLGLNKFLSR